jgi:hypothetical protein
VRDLYLQVTAAALTAHLQQQIHSTGSTSTQSTAGPRDILYSADGIADSLCSFELLSACVILRDRIEEEVAARDEAISSLGAKP